MCVIWGMNVCTGCLLSEDFMGKSQLASTVSKLFLSIFYRRQKPRLITLIVS
jgi:hypothetical protein